MAELADSWAREIRDFLLGRLGSASQVDYARRTSSRLPTPRIRDWWILSGKRYVGLDAGIADEMPRIHRMTKTLLASYNPTWRSDPVPHGEVDWIATALLRTTSMSPDYVLRTTNVGLSSDERSVLLGWTSWIRRLYVQHFTELRRPVPELPRWDHEAPLFDLGTVLVRWARVAKRSRWPLLRNVVAESLRCYTGEDDLDRLPLPSSHEDLFELVVLVRLLRHLGSEGSQIQWLDNQANNNELCTDTLVVSFQRVLGVRETLHAGMFPREAIAAMEAHHVSPPSRSDLIIRFRTPRAGFHGILIECKSGNVQPRDTVYQLLAYRSVLRRSEPGRYLVWGVTQATAVHVRLPVDVDGDHWAFSDHDRIADVLEALGLRSG